MKTIYVKLKNHLATLRQKSFNKYFKTKEQHDKWIKKLHERLNIVVEEGLG